MPMQIKKGGKKVEVVQPMATITEHKANGDELITQEPVGDELITKDRPMANVGFSAAIKRNDGNYGSNGFTVSLFIPCDIDAKVIEETFQEIVGWVNGKAEELLGDM